MGGNRQTGTRLTLAAGIVCVALASTHTNCGSTVLSSTVQAHHAAPQSNVTINPKSAGAGNVTDILLRIESLSPAEVASTFFAPLAVAAGVPSGKSITSAKRQLLELFKRPATYAFLYRYMPDPVRAMASGALPTLPRMKRGRDDEALGAAGA